MGPKNTNTPSSGNPLGATPSPIPSTPTPTQGTTPPQGTPSSAPTRNSAAPAFSGSAPIINPFAGQNIIPSSATGDIILKPDKADKKPKKGLIIAIIIGIIFIAGLSTAAVLLTSPSASQVSNTTQSSGYSDSGQSSTGLSDQTIAAYLYLRADNFQNEIVKQYSKSPNSVNTLINNELEIGNNVQDNNSSTIISALTNYYELFAERLEIYSQKECIVNGAFNMSCVMSANNDKNNTQLIDKNTIMNSLVNTANDTYLSLSEQYPDAVKEATLMMEEKNATN